MFVKFLPPEQLRPEKKTLFLEREEGREKVGEKHRPVS